MKIEIWGKRSCARCQPTGFSKRDYPSILKLFVPKMKKGKITRIKTCEGWRGSVRNTELRGHDSVEEKNAEYEDPASD